MLLLNLIIGALNAVFIDIPQIGKNRLFQSIDRREVFSPEAHLAQYFFRYGIIII